MKTTFESLVGPHVFTLVPKLDIRHPVDADASGVMFGLDEITYLVFEDPSDGYRSSAGPILSFVGSAYELGGSYHEYLREDVICSNGTKSEYGGEADTLEVRSVATGKLIFRAGTDNSDDYYPSYVAEWHPEGLAQNADVQEPLA